MSTPYLLICVEKPKEKPDSLSAKPSEQWPRWFGFLKELETLSLPASSILRPSENTLLIPLDQFVSAGAKVLALPALQGMEHKVFYLETEPRQCS
jgi:hypothetical protein